MSNLELLKARERDLYEQSQNLLKQLGYVRREIALIERKDDRAVRLLREGHTLEATYDRDGGFAVFIDGQILSDTDEGEFYDLDSNPYLEAHGTPERTRYTLKQP